MSLVHVVVDLLWDAPAGVKALAGTAAMILIVVADVVISRRRRVDRLARSAR